MFKSFFLKSFTIFLMISGALQAVPVISQISPESGPEAGGTVVTIIGSGFTGTTAVMFGSTNAASFVVNSDTSITAISPIAVFGNVNISVTTPTGISQAQQSSLFTYTGQWKVLTSNIGNNSVTVINAGTNTVQNTITTDASIFNIGITPDGSKAYMLDTVGDRVDPLNLANYALSPPIFLGVNSFPIDIAISPDGSKAYIANQNADSVSVIDVATNTVATTIVIAGQGPFSIALTPDGSLLYVADENTGDITLIDTATNTIIGMPFTASTPVDLAISPDGTRGYIVERVSNRVTVFNVATNTIITNVTVGLTPFGIALTPDGTRGYVTNSDDGTVSVIDLATNTVIGSPIPVGDSPLYPATAPDGQSIYVPNALSDTVSVISVASNTVIATIPVGPNPRTVAITPDQAPVARFTSSASNFEVTFDATGSISPVGGIALYLWNFGDGQVLTTSSPITTHTYSSLGPFVVTLQVINTAGTSTAQVYNSWIVDREGGPTAVTSSILNLGMFEPSNFKGRTVKNKFATQTDLIHQLTWTPSSSPFVLSYLIYRNGEFIGAVPSTGPFIFNDHNRRKKEVDVYSLVAVFATGQTSIPQLAIVP